MLPPAFCFGVVMDQQKLLAWIIRGLNGCIDLLEYWQKTFGDLPDEQADKVIDYVHRLNKLS